MTGTVTETAKKALAEFRAIQQGGYLSISRLRKMDDLIEVIRAEGKKHGLTAGQVVELLEGPGRWRTEWS